MRQGCHGARLVVEIVTDAQQRVYAFVRQYLADHGYAPTVREVQQGIGYGSTSTAHLHIKALVSLGYLAGSGRTLRLGWKGQDAGIAG